jgi:O-methyltransferase involved in polyketide biosynthesis
MWVEQPCVGVPGLGNYLSARSRWLDLQINAACRTEAVTQAVILRSGLDSRACRLKVPGLQFYEVDDREVLAQKRALLDAGELVAGGGRR